MASKLRISLKSEEVKTEMIIGGWSEEKIYDAANLVITKRQNFRAAASTSASSRTTLHLRLITSWHQGRPSLVAVPPKDVPCY
jgi:hypothetical protein